jgi:hypothetical protein
MSAKPATTTTHQSKEANMANIHKNNQRADSAPTSETSIGPRRYPSALHAMLRMTPEEVNHDIKRRGKTPESVSRDFDGMMRELRRLYAPPKPRRNLPSILSDDFPTELAALRFYDDKVAAGIPSWNSDGEHFRSTTMSDAFGRLDPANTIVAKVSGNSMRDAHIVDGDIVIVDIKAKPKDGDLVLAYLSGQGEVVKRLRMLAFNQIVLESANPAFQPIAIKHPDDLVIHGVVVARSGQV